MMAAHLDVIKFLSSRERALAGSTRWLDVLVQPEQVIGIVMVLHGDQALVLKGPKRVTDAILRREVQVCGSGRERAHGVAKRAARRDQRLVIRGLLPHRDRMEQVIRITMREGGRVVCDRRNALTDPEDDHLA